MGINIKDEIRKLIDLQAIDSQLYQLKKEKAEKPKVIAALQAEHDKKSDILKEFEDRSQTLILKRKDKEGELATKEESITKLKSKQFTLKTNKEMDALLVEIKGIEMDKSLLEEDILKIFDEQDSLQKELDQQKVVLKEYDVEFQKQKQEILSTLEIVETKIAELESKRASTEKEIDLKILARYNRILKSKQDCALAAVVNNSCQGCYMNVTHQVVNEIKMHTELITCASCARLLYTPEDYEQ